MRAAKFRENAIGLAAWMMMAAMSLDAPADMNEADSGDTPPVALKASVQSFEGNCFYRHSEDQDYKPLEQGIELGVGGQIKTGLRGTVQVVVGPNADLTIKPLTVMTIGQLEQDGDTLRTLLAMPQGKFEFHVKRVGFQNDFKVATPTGTIAVKGTQGSVSSFEETNIDGNSTNFNKAISITNKSDGKRIDLSRDQEFGGKEIIVGATGPGGAGGREHGGRGGDNTDPGDGKGSGGVLEIFGGRAIRNHERNPQFGQRKPICHKITQAGTVPPGLNGIQFAKISCDAHDLNGRVP